MMRRTYRLAAEACAEIVARVPALERPFVACGPMVWQAPGIGRFYRSAAHRLASRLRAERTPFRSVSVGGQRLILDIAAFTATSRYFGGPVYEPVTTRCFSQLLRPGDVFVDIGANHGYFTLLAASLVGDRGRVVAFEPNPPVFEQLRTHVHLNGFEPRVSLEPYALGDAPTRDARLYLSRDVVNTGLSSLTPDPEVLAAGGLSADATLTVSVDTFDRWFQRSGLDRVDLVKIDVEGAEALVMAGMRTALRTGRLRHLVVETVWNGSVHEALVAAGYDARPLDRAPTLTNVLFTWRGDVASR